MERQTHLPRKLLLVCPVVCGLLIRSVGLFELYRHLLKCILKKEGMAISLQQDGISDSGIVLSWFPAIVLQGNVIHASSLCRNLCSF